MSVCSASAAFLPAICPGFAACNPNFIQLGDTVTIELCVENRSEQPTQDMPPFPRVSATLMAGSHIEVFLMCRESECSTPQLSNTLTVESFAPANGINSSFALGTTTNCRDGAACGLLSLASDVALPPSSDPLCLGTIVATTQALPIGSNHGLFYTRINTGPTDLRGNLLMRSPAC